MSDQMISSGSAAHAGGGMDVSGAIAAIKKQLSEITKILNSHESQLKKVEKLDALYKEMVKSMNGVKTAASQAAAETGKAADKANLLDQAMGIGSRNAKKLADATSEINKKTEELNKNVEKTSQSEKKIIDAKRKLKKLQQEAATYASKQEKERKSAAIELAKTESDRARKLIQNYQSVLNVVSRLRTQLSGAEISGAVFGKKFNVSSQFQKSFKNGLQSLIGEAAKVSGGPQDITAQKLAARYEAVSKVLGKIKAKIKELQEAKPLGAETRIKNLRKQAQGLIPTLKKLNVELSRMGAQQMRAGRVNDVRNFQHQVKKDAIASLRRLNIEKLAIKGGGVATSVGSRLRLVNIELEKYAILAKRGYTADTKYAQSLGFTAKKVQELHNSQKMLNKEMAAKSGMSGGGTTNWMTGAMQQMKYWGRLRLMFAGFQKVMSGFREFGEIEGTINRALRTSVKDLSDWNAVAQARNELQQAATRYLSEHIGTVAEYTEAIYQLTQAEMERSEAIKLAPTIMSLSKALDAPIAESSRLMVGLNELFKENLKGMETDSERINYIASVMAVAVKKEVTSVEMLTKALGYIAPIAKVANVSLEEVIGSVAVLHTNLMLASRSGTGMRQMINAIAKDTKKLNEAFGLGIDDNAPLQYLETLKKLSERIKAGKLSVGELTELLGGFKLRGAPTAIILAQEIDKIVTRVNQLKGAKLDDLLGMRDVVEKNVPAQMKILSKNVDMVIASFLRGSVGGQNMADSLGNVNEKMFGVQQTAKNMGKVIAAVANKYTLIGGAALYAAAKIRNVIVAMRTAKAVSAGSVVGISLGVLTGAIALYTHLQGRSEERIRQMGEEIRKGKEEERQLDELIRALKTSKVSSEQLAAAKKLLTKEGRKNIDMIQNETEALKESIRQLEEKERLVSENNKRKATERAELQLKGATVLEPPRAQIAAGTGTLGMSPTFIDPSNKKNIAFAKKQLESAKEYIKLAKEADFSGARIKKDVKSILEPAYSAVQKLGSGIEGVTNLLQRMSLVMSNPLLESQVEKAKKAAETAKKDLEKLQAAQEGIANVFGASATKLFGFADKLREKRTKAIEEEIKLIKKRDKTVSDETARQMAEKKVVHKNLRKEIARQNVIDVWTEKKGEQIRTDPAIMAMMKEFSKLGPNTSARMFQQFQLGTKGGKSTLRNETEFRKYAEILKKAFPENWKTIGKGGTAEYLKSKGVNKKQLAYLEKNKDVKKQLFENVKPGAKGKVATAFEKLSGPMSELVTAQETYKAEIKKNVTAIVENTTALNNAAGMYQQQFDPEYAAKIKKDNAEKFKGRMQGAVLGKFDVPPQKKFELPGPYKIEQPKNADGSSSINNFSRVNLTLNLDGKEIEKVVTEQGKTIDVVLPITEKLKEAQVKTEKQRLAFGQRMAQMAQK